MQEQQENNQASTKLLRPGALISNRYQIERCLGEGGMGAVYLARDKVLEQRQVAVKVLHSEFTRDPELAKRFMREVKLMHSLTHPNVVRTYDIGRDGEHIYFTMEYITGTSLDRLLANQTLNIKTILDITKQICAALAAIHGAEIIHRDLKPGNVLILKDLTVKLTDFGVARPKESKLTQHNEIIGSVDYMAPEIWSGKELTVSVDFYALGVILYEMLTGELPFKADEPAQMMWLHIKKAPVPPKELRPDVPNWLNLLVLKLMAKNSGERPSSAHEILTTINNHFRPAETSPDGVASVVTMSGSFRTISSGVFPTTTSTAAVRLTRKDLQRKSKRRLQTLAIAGTAIIALAMLFREGLGAVIRDLFPY